MLQTNPEIEKWLVESNPHAVEHLAYQLRHFPDGRGTKRGLKDLLELFKNSVKKFERLQDREADGIPAETNSHNESKLQVFVYFSRDIVIILKNYLQRLECDIFENTATVLCNLSSANSIYIITY